MGIFDPVLDFAYDHPWYTVIAIIIVELVLFVILYFTDLYKAEGGFYAALAHVAPVLIGGLLIFWRIN